MTVRQVVAGVSSQDSASLSWTVDAQADRSTPAFQLTSQYASDAQGLVFANTATPLIGGLTEAGASVKVYDNGSLLQTLTADAAGRWSLSAVLTGSAHSFTTQVTDMAGNASMPSTALSFTVLTSPPAAPVATVVAGGDSGASSTDGITNVSSQWFTGTVGLIAGQAAPTVMVYDNGVLLGSVQADASGAWAFNATGLAQGGHVLSVRAKDAAGNLSVATTVASLAVDTTAPVSLLQPTLASGEDTGTSASDAVTQKPQAAFTGTAEAGATVELYDNGVLVGSAQANTTTGVFNVSPSLALAQGNHSVTWLQVDAAGNRSAASSAKTITVDSVMGAVTYLSLSASNVLYSSGGEVVTQSILPTLNGYGEAGATVEVFNGSTSLGTTLAGTDGAWRFVLTADLAASNTLSAKQTDAAGNVSASSAALNVAYNATATQPVIKLKSSSDTGLVGDGITASSTPTLVGTGATSGDTMELYNGSTKIGSAVADGAGKWAVSPSD